MGVYINMKMPKEGDLIVIRPDWKAYYVSANPQNAYEGEAVPVPPHGRLIDADSFLSLINDSTILSDFLKCIINPLIRGEPTVIEAEEGE